MRRSKFNKETKLKILKEKELFDISVEELCVKHKISQPTYYNWRRELLTESTETDLQQENKILRRLYIDLSEHNYQLAQFLNQ